MTADTCARCDRPTPDGYACSHCANRATGQLQAIADMAGAARDVAHGLTRRATAGAAGKPGSQLPLDLTAMAKLDAVQATLTTWARHVASERGIALPEEVRHAR